MFGWTLKQMLMVKVDFNGCFSAGCDPRKLPGSAKRRLLKNQRWLGKSIEEASDKVKTREARNSTDVFICAFFSPNLVVLVLAAAPKIMCLCTSLTTGHPVFWPFLMMKYVLFYFLLWRLFTHHFLQWALFGVNHKQEPCITIHMLLNSS